MLALVGGILLLLLAAGLLVPLVWRAGQRLPIGSRFGVRTALTCANEENWVLGHQVAAPFLVIAALLAVINAFALVAFTTESGFLVQLGGFVMSLICPLAVRFLAGKAADRAVKLRGVKQSKAESH